jgi:succinylarginine dihydrolase
MTVLNTPALIDGARLLTLRQMLKLEMVKTSLGFLSRSKGRTAYAILKDMGFKGSREKVLKQLDEIRNELTGRGAV